MGDGVGVGEWNIRFDMSNATNNIKYYTPIQSLDIHLHFYDVPIYFC